ncbi:MAG: NADH-quinone oxidoreductase subunit H [Coriobacteriia bacterium]|nr:NADH-quinone oxidoreductase subunit H [Coriobacteriia bacterium]
MNAWLQAVLWVLMILVVMLANGSLIIYMLRKVLGAAHLRIGPQELGPAGIFQLIPDIIKLLTKEDRHPNNSDRWLYILAPIIIFLPVLVAFGFLPFGYRMVAADINMGIMMMIAFIALVPLGVFAAGWASHNKYSLIGAIRSIAATITYEIPLLLSVIPVVIMAGSLNLSEIVLAQANSIWFVIPALPSAIIFLICAQMETNQAPFDMTEAEGELVAGFSTEYSAMRFGFIFLAEFAGNFVLAGLAVTLFLGGWTLPGVDPATMGILAPVVFVIKTYAVIFLFMMVRGNFSRFRIDRLAQMGWKRMIPFTLVWTIVFAIGYRAFQLWQPSLGSLLTSVFGGGG